MRPILCYEEQIYRIMGYHTFMAKRLHVLVYNETVKKVCCNPIKQQC